jgi:hypothetical protein
LVWAVELTGGALLVGAATVVAEGLAGSSTVLSAIRVAAVVPQLFWVAVGLNLGGLADQLSETARAGAFASRRRPQPPDSSIRRRRSISERAFADVRWLRLVAFGVSLGGIAWTVTAVDTLVS